MKFCYIIETQFKQPVTKLGLSYVLPPDYFVINFIMGNELKHNTYDNK